MVGGCWRLEPKHAIKIMEPRWIIRLPGSNKVGPGSRSTVFLAGPLHLREIDQRDLATWPPLKHPPLHWKQVDLKNKRLTLKTHFHYLEAFARLGHVFRRKWMWGWTQSKVREFLCTLPGGPFKHTCRGPPSSGFREGIWSTLACSVAKSTTLSSSSH